MEKRLQDTPVICRGKSKRCVSSELLPYHFASYNFIYFWLRKSCKSNYDLALLRYEQIKLVFVYMKLWSVKRLKTKRWLLAWWIAYWKLSLRFQTNDRHWECQMKIFEKSSYWNKMTPSNLQGIIFTAHGQTVPSLVNVRMDGRTVWS